MKDLQCIDDSLLLTWTRAEGVVGEGLCEECATDQDGEPLSIGAFHHLLALLSMLSVVNWPQQSNEDQMGDLKEIGLVQPPGILL